MARPRILILDQPIANNYTIAFWLDVPLARQKFYANPTKGSVFLDITPTDLGDLRAGNFTEQVDLYTPTPGLTLAQIQASVIDAWTGRQAEVNSTSHPWKRYGTSYDGSSWTVTNIS